MGALAAAMAEVTGSSRSDPGTDISLPLDEMIRTAAPELSTPLRCQIGNAFRRHYDARFWADATVYRGAAACLDRLHDAGLRLFVVTNKRVSSATLLLDRFGMAEHLEAVIAQPDIGPPLAKSMLVGRCLGDAGLTSREAVLIGDSDQDGIAAAGQGIAFIAVTSGAGPLGHRPGDKLRVEVAGLEDAATSVLAERPGRNA